MMLLKKSYETGAMVHVSTQKVDEGPVISFGRYSFDDENFREEWKIIERMLIKEMINMEKIYVYLI